MEATALQTALETRFFPHVESIGFIRDKPKESRIISFRRRTDSAMQLFAVLWERHGRPRFIVQFAEAPLAGIDSRGEHVPAEDVLPGNVALLRGWINPALGSRWFASVRPLWRRLLWGQRNDSDRVVELLLALFPEVTEWWKTKTEGPHLKVFPAISLPPKASHPPVEAGIFSFRYTTAEYRCTKCSNASSEHGTSLSIPYVIAALFGTVPLFVMLFRAPWNFPWYYFFSIFAGELLLLFVAGFPFTLFNIATGGGSIARPCPSCGASMTFRGRHITNSQKPRWTDVVLLVLFCALNVLLWVNLFHHA
jgi:hypothetical protein